MKVIKIDWRQAATEFVVIVFGVLVALAVDGWRDEYQDRKIEAEYLDRLRVDIESDVKVFDEFEQILETKARFLQSLLDGDTIAEFGRNEEALMEAIKYSFFTGMPVSVSTTFDELRTTGRLALIQDVNQRDALSKYYSGFEHISEVLAQPSGDLDQIMSASVSGAVIRDWRLSRIAPEITELQQALDDLQGKPELASMVNNAIAYSTEVQYWVARYRRQANELLQLLGE